MAVRYYNDESVYRLYAKRAIAKWIEDVVREEGYTPCDITYIFCSPQRHIEINRQYLGHNYHTDVITFDYSDLSDAMTVSGDIFIDPRTVRLNAREYADTARNEMLRVLVHGVLHLCGYKDKEPEEQNQMRGKEDYYLARYCEQPDK